jgi:acyl-coenzyme A thioesterase PaaI-like protein
METFDLEINGRPKGVSHGGGYCGLLNTVVALALQEYLGEKGAYAPGLLIMTLQLVNYLRRSIKRIQRQ